MKSLAASLGFAYVAHSPALTALILPALGALVAAEVAWIAHRVRRTKVTR